MIEENFYCFANDREIRDLLMSSKQKITPNVLLEMGRSRGIFFSPNEQRENLVSKIAALPHSFDDVEKLLQSTEHTQRAEKMTCITLQTKAEISEIKEVIDEYKKEWCRSQDITHFNSGENSIAMNVEYNEYDYSKTRLIQRQPKEADFLFLKNNDQISIRMPANEKAWNIIEIIKDKLESKIKSPIPLDEIELSSLDGPGRTKFFTDLFSLLPGYNFDTVTKLKIAPLNHKTNEDELNIEIDDEELIEDSEVEDLKQKLLAQVNKVSLSGNNLYQS